MSRRKITEIIIHHTAGSLKETIPEIINHHKHKNGWRACGYHRIYNPTTKTTHTTDRPLDNDVYLDDFEVGAGVYGYNRTTVHYCIIGYYHPPVNNELSEEDIEHVINDMVIMCKRYKPSNPKLILGHRDVGASACPGDNVYKLLPRIRKEVQKRIGE